MKKRVTTIASIAFALTLALATFTGVVSADGHYVTLAGGFNGPQGVLVAPDGSVWVIDSGVGGDTEMPFFNPETGEETTATFGETARVVRIAPDGSQSVAANLPSVLVGMEAIGGARLALLNGTLYATSGGWMGESGPEPAAPNVSSVVKIEDAQVTEVASTWDVEGSQNPDGFIEESHPYGITAGPDGYLWVADAGANDLLRIDPSTGEIELVAVFEGVPGPLPNPGRGGAMESDPVPTAVAFDGSGDIFVSFLPGFPFLPGSAKVVRVTRDGQVSDYANGLTMVTDLRAGPDGNLYAVQFGQFTEQGPVPNSGSILRIKEGGVSEVVMSDLSFPTSIDFTPAGDAYVAINGVGAPGTGEVVMVSGLTSRAGSPLSPASLPTTGGERTGGLWSIAAFLGLGLALVAAGLLLRRTRALAGARR